jgi:YidC/Oxa1 family membrane protein insertase
VAEFSPEKRLLIAFALSIVIFLAWSWYMRAKYPAPPPQPVPVEEPTAQPAAPSPSISPPASAGKPAGLTPGALPSPEPRQATELREIVLETPTATVRLSNEGAVVTSWTLKDYHDAAGKPLELVQGRTTRLGWPLAFQLDDSKLEEKLNTALYLLQETSPAELIFEWSDGQVAARKHLRFTPDGLCEIRTAVFAGDRPVPHRVAWRGGFGEQAVAARGTTVVPPQVFVRKPDALHRQLALQAGETTGWLWKSASPFPYSGEGAYAGIEDQYFVALFLPQRPELSTTAWATEWTPPPDEDGKKKESAKIGAVAVGAESNGNALRLFVGPKDIQALERLQAPALASGARPQLSDELVDYGWFSFIAKPLLWAMQWLYHRAIPNYGWVIVLLTVFINFALFPLKLKSMESAWRMQKLAPQMKAIQERYKQYKFNDPRKQKMQQEIMALYQEHGVNPLGGCLPLLLQIPFFFGFYKVLAISIELRQAPWFGWIRDLSQHDPYFILPVVMTASMYLSTRMTPMTTADPMQQRMMRLMPLVFGFMFLWFSSGLVLYWMCSNLVGIGQQWWINRRHRLHDEAEKLAARERKKKKKRPELSGEEGEP